MQSKLMNIILLFGGLQAILLIIGVNIRKPLNGHKKKATTILLTFALLAMIYYVSIVAEWETLYSYIWMSGSISWMALLPSYFLFTKALTFSDFKFKWSQLTYFVVPMFFMVNSILMLLFEYNLFAWTKTMETYLDVWMSIFFISSAIFTYLTYEHLKQNQGHELTRVLNFFTKLFIGILSIYALAFILIRKNYDVLFELSLICIFEVMIFGMVFRAFRLAPSHSLFAEPKYQNLNSKNEIDFSETHDKVSEIIKLKELYRDPKLNLSKLSEQTGISQNQLSQYFNIGLESSFYEFINERRLLHVEKLIHNGEHKDLTITGLAYESGFNSKTTFYKAFKEKHEITPSEFIKKMKIPSN